MDKVRLALVTEFMVSMMLENSAAINDEPDYLQWCGMMYKGNSTIRNAREAWHWIKRILGINPSNRACTPIALLEQH
jgi:hypothetical protein